MTLTGVFNVFVNIKKNRQKVKIIIISEVSSDHSNIVLHPACKLYARAGVAPL